MKDIPSDGDCLYSAIVHQLEKVGIKSSVKILRSTCADYIRKHSEDFESFLESDLELYCQKVKIIFFNFNF